MTKFITCSVISFLVVGLCSTGLAGDVTIDAFTDLFEGEAFVGSYSNNTVGSTYTRHGLEVGYLYSGAGVSPGDPLPAVDHRAQETQTQIGLSGVLGGSRYGELNASPLSYSRVSANAYKGFFSYSTAFGTQGILDLVYQPVGGLNSDFSTVSGDARFEIELVSGDMHVPGYSQYDRPVPISLTLTSGLGTTDEATATVSNMLLTEQVYGFAFGDFAGIDFSDIDSIGLHIDQSDPDTAAVDFSLSNFKATTGTDFPNIPEPTTILLLIAGMPLLARRRRHT